MQVMQTSCASNSGINQGILQQIHTTPQTLKMMGKLVTTNAYYKQRKKKKSSIFIIN